jgi:hypothetical protein
MTTEDAIERVALREAMLESLRREEPQQYGGFKRNTATVLLERGLPVLGDSAHGADLRRIDNQRFREILWKLINSGILVPGMDSSNENWPFLSITEIGQDYLDKGGPDVYDPEGYVGQVATRHPIDEVEARYLGQAIAAFDADLPDASAVMLGATAEHIILVLAETIAETDEDSARDIERLRDGPALRLLRHVNSYLEEHGDKLSRRLREQREANFGSVASIIRVARNDGGHPALDVVDRDQALLLLRIFPNFRNWGYDVMSELRAEAA